MSLDEFGLVDLSKIEKKDYGRLFLKRNPFPSTAVPSDSPLTTADRKPVLRRFVDVLSTLHTDNYSSVTVLLGDYGTGKSHLLKLLKASVNNQLLHSNNPTLAIYAKSPGRNIRDLLLYLLDDLGRAFLTELSMDFIFSYLLRNDQQKYLIKGRDITLVDSTQIPAFLENSMVYTLMADIRYDLKNVKNQDLVNSFLSLSHPTFGPIAWRWFVGSSLSKDDKNALKVQSPIDDSRVAEDVLNSLQELLHSVGIKGLIFLIDELEAITLIPGISKGLYQDALRHLIDNNPTGLVLVFAITPTEWNNLTKTPSALERRLAGSVIDLPPFGEHDVLELISKYLETVRVPEFDSTKRPKIFPFTTDSIQRIYVKTKGIPEKVVTLCRLCVDNFATDDVDQIDPGFVENVIRKEGFRVRA